MKDRRVWIYYDKNKRGVWENITNQMYLPECTDEFILNDIWVFSHVKEPPTYNAFTLARWEDWTRNKRDPVGRHHVIRIEDKWYTYDEEGNWKELVKPIDMLRHGVL